VHEPTVAFQVADTKRHVSHSQLWVATILVEQHRPTPILSKKPSQVLACFGQICWVFVEHDQNFVSGDTFIKAVNQSFEEWKPTNLIEERTI
jgi:hypothetical protein